mmetsp:Transcript_69537/g.184566  ORF Transcript_69537/g.184566 Transcript_69537/m.184566 type:complete len:304 (-) Transcript_69537:149-1060(-)
MGRVLLGVILLEDLQGGLDTCDAFLERLVLFREQIALFLAHLVHRRLRRRQLGQLLLQSGDAILQLRGISCHLVDLGGQLLDRGALLRLLRLRVLRLLVAIRLLLGVLGGILLQLRDHLLDQPRDLLERVLAVPRPQAHRRGQVRDELRERRGPPLPRQRAHEADGARGVVGSAADAAHLQEGRRRGLRKGDGRRASRGLLDDRDGLLDRRQLLGPAGRRGVVLLRVRGAALLDVLEHRLVLCEVLRRVGQRPLRCGLFLAGLGHRCLRLLHALVAVGDAILEGLLEELERVLGLALLGASIR